jgi:NitT/TauT family transport system substrate-binding protein
MTDALLAYAVAKMRQYGIVDSGDAEKNGLGAMSDARWQDFYRLMATEGLYRGDLDYHRAYVLDFVNKRVGMELKK